MKVTIREGVTGVRLRDAVPPLYRDEIVMGIDPADVYMLALCTHAEHDVLHSAPLLQAFRRLGEPAPNGVIVVETVLTDWHLLVNKIN